MAAMTRPICSTRLAARAPILAAALAGVTLAGLGCDAEAEARRDAAASLDKAFALVGTGEAQARQEAISLLSAAGSTDTDNPAGRAQAARLLGMAEQMAGDLMAAEALERAIAADRLAFEVMNVADVATRNGQSVQAMRLMDPAPTIELVNRLAGEVQGDGGAETWQAADTDMPTLEAVRQDVSRIRGEIAALEDEASSLATRQRNLRSEAADLFDQADRTRGQSGVEVFTQAADREAEAGKLAVETLRVEGKLEPLRLELEQLTAQEEVLANTVTLMEELAASLNDRQETLNREISQQQAIIDSLATGNENSIAAVAEELAAMVSGEEGIEPALAGALEAYDRAGQRYAEAASAAGQYTPDTSGTGPVVEVRNRISGLLARPTFEVLGGVAEARRGQTQANAALAAGNRLLAAEAVAAASEKAGITVPDALQLEAVRERFRTLAEEADASLAAAAETLEGVANGRFTNVPRERQDVIKSAARTGAAAALFNRAKLAERLAVAGDGGAVDRATEYTQTARGLLSDLDPTQAARLPASLQGGGTNNQGGGFGGDIPAENPDAEIDAPADDQPSEDEE
jgi:hypothetical protein